MMKKIISIAFVLLTFISYGQYPVTQNLGGGTTLVSVPPNGALRASLINRNFSDTASANLTPIRYYAGAQIFTVSDTTIWYRSVLTNKWIPMLGGIPSSGGGGYPLMPYVWMTNGNNAISSVYPYAKLMTLDSVAVHFGTRGLTRFSIAPNGLSTGTPGTHTMFLGVEDTTSSDKRLVWLQGGGGGFYTAGNGIYLSGNQFRLGGAITENTIMSGSGIESFILEQLNDFQISSNNAASNITVSVGIRNNVVQMDGNGLGLFSVKTSGPPTSSLLRVTPDSIMANPDRGIINIDTLASLISSSDKVAVWDSVTGRFGSKTMNQMAWGLNGNSGTTSSNFLGTTDNAALRFRQKNQRAGYIDSATGNTMYGIMTGNGITPSGNWNTYIGEKVGYQGTGSNNTGVGFWALRDITLTSELTAIGGLSQAINRGGYRSTTMGYASGLWWDSVNTSVSLGNMSATTGRKFDNITAVGYRALSGIRMNGENTAVGAISAQFTTTGVRAYVVSSSSDWTGAVTLNFPAPTGVNDPGAPSSTAAGTAVVVGNTIVGVDMTDFGQGYIDNDTSLTVTAVGSGSSALIKLSFVKAVGNTSIGVASSLYNKWGSYNFSGGYAAGGISGNERAFRDSLSTHLGANSSRHSAIPSFTQLVNATSIGANSKVGKSNTLILGDSLTSTSVGIGTSFVNNSALLDMTSTTKGFLAPRMTATQRNAISSPATGLLVYDTDSTRYMLYNGSAWLGIKYTFEGGGGGGTVTASNGLTKVVNDIQLGGTLTGATIINGSQLFAMTGLSSYQFDATGNSTLSTTIGSFNYGLQLHNTGANLLAGHNSISGYQSAILVNPDSISVQPKSGIVNIDSLRSVSSTTGLRLLLRGNGGGVYETDVANLPSSSIEIDHTYDSLAWGKATDILKIKSIRHQSTSGALTYTPTYTDSTASYDASIATNGVTNAMLRQSAGLSVIGRSANTTGNVADISAANDGEVLRRSGTNIGFGTIATAGIGNSQVTYGKIQDVGANEVLGRAAGTSGAVSGIAIGASQLFGRGATGDLTPITLGTNLSMSGTTLNASGAGGGLGDPGANGVVVRTALNTTTARTITGTSNLITVTDGDGVSGNPTLTVGSDVARLTTDQTFTGVKTFTRGSSSVPSLVITPVSGGTPSSPSNGMIWWRSESGTLRAWSSSEREFTWNDASQTLTNKTFSTSNSVTTGFTYTAGVKQVFDADGTSADIQLTGHAGNPSSLSNGDMWYNSSTNTLMARLNGVSVDLNKAEVDDQRDSYSTQAIIQSDFWQLPSTTATDNAFRSSVTGAGSGWTEVTATTAEMGVLAGSTGTTATGRSNLATNPAITLLSNGEAIFEWKVRVPTLSTSGERYSLFVGLGDVTTSGNQVDGVAFVYDEGGVTTGSAASANWQIVTSSNSTRTWTTTSTAVGTSFTTLKAVVNSAGSSVEFFVNGTSVGTHTTNIPTGAGRATGVNIVILKSVGTTARTVEVDYAVYTKKFSTPR